MAERCAVIGVGQTKHDAKRIDVSQVGLVREAALRALEDAGMTWRTSTPWSIGKAPDLFEGVMMPELFLADALGCTGKPMLRVHTAGSVGGSTAIVAASLVQAGVHERVLTVAYEKQSESNAMWALSIKRPFTAGHGGGRRRLLRPADPRLHAPLRRARGHRHPRRAEGPPERAQEPLRAPQDPGRRLRPDRELADALGPDPLPRDLPVVGRRLRDGARQREVAGRPASRRPGCTPRRCAPSRPCSRAATR